MLYHALCTDSDYEIYFESDLIDLKTHDESIDFYEGENRIGATAYCFAWSPNGNEKITSNDSFNTTVIVFPYKSDVKSLESMLSALGITAELYHQYELQTRKGDQMTIEETLKLRLHNYYLEVLTNAREDKHPDTKQYADIFSIYCKCILDACSDLCDASEEMKVYAAELKDALTREVAFLKKQHDLRVARQALEKITWYRELSELLPVLSCDDLIYVYQHSSRAASTYIDDVEYFHGIIEKMQIKYNLRVSK